MDKNIKSLLTTISDYCVENPEYCFWYSSKSNYYRLYLGYKTTYNQFKQGCPDFYGIINNRFIKETDMVFDYNSRADVPIAQIQTYHDWDKQDTHRYKLFTYCRERVDNEFLYINCFSTFFNSRKEPVDIEKCLYYGNFKTVDDWTFFTHNITAHDWEQIWSNYPQVSSLANYFNDNFNSQQKKEFLTPMIVNDFLSQINEQSLNFYQFLSAIFNTEEIKEYSQYSIVKKSLENVNVYSDEDNNTHIEKVVTNQNIFKIKDFESYSVIECNSIYIYIINEFNESLQLKKCGLINIDAVINKEDYKNIFYINQKQDCLFNKKHFKDLFMQALEVYVIEPKLESLKEKIPTIINNWYLQNSLDSKPKKTSQLKI